MANLIGTAPNQVPTNADLGSAAYINTEQLPVSDPQQSALDNKVSKVVSTDNAIVRFDGTGGAVQNSTAVIDDAGNMGLSMTPSAWNSNYKALQFSWGAVASDGGYVGNINILNAAYIGTGGSSDWRYADNSKAGRYQIEAGVHSWHTAPSGTAGNPITFTQAMTLDASGNLYLPCNFYIGDSTHTTSQVSSGSGAAPLLFGINGTERMRLDTSGNLGIGTTSPSQKLHVAGTGYASSDFRAPIFYDSDNTSYYVDPASTSNLVGLTVTNTITGSVSGSSASCTGNAVTATNSDTLDGVHANQLFCNHGQVHGTQGDFNAISDFGFRYVSGATNGPGTGSPQFYGFSIGLGSDYSFSQYALQFAIPRYNSSDKYLSMRTREGGTWGSWVKIYAGYADSAGSSSSCSGNAATATTATNQSGGTVTATTGSFSGRVAINGSATETKVALSSGAINLSSGGYFTYTISSATTFSLSNIPTSGNGISFILELTNAGSYTITWFSGIKWANGGVAPVLTTGIDSLGFYSHDGGTSWRGFVLGKNMA